MEKERAIQCIPTELMDRFKELAVRFWEEKNPGAVRLNALLEEFGPEIKTLGQMIKQYESDYASRLALGQGKFEQKEARLNKEMEDLKARLGKVEAEKAAVLKRAEELRAALAEKEKILTDLKAKTTEEEGDLNSKYVARMEDLYEKVSKKERDMLSRWEDKNRSIEAKALDTETELSMRGKQLKLREKALEEDFNARKTELIKTFDRIREGLEAREKALAVREAASPKGGSI